MKTTTLTDLKIEVIGMWCGVVFLALVVIGWVVVAGFIPLHSPSATVEQVFELYRENHTRIVFGMLMVMMSSFFWCPFSGVALSYLSRVEGRVGVLTWSAAIGVVGNLLGVFFAPFFWLTAAFRPDADPNIIYLMNDLGWLVWVGALAPVLPLMFGFGVAAFIDKDPNPVFPRWYGYLSILTVIGMLPDQLLFYFHSGPFAWNGIFSFWIAFSLFINWVVVLFYLLGKAIQGRRAQLSRNSPSP